MCAGCPGHGEHCAVLAVLRVILVIIDIFRQGPPQLPESKNQPRKPSALLIVTEKPGWGPASVVLAGTQVVLATRHVRGINTVLAAVCPRNGDILGGRIFM